MKALNQENFENFSHKIFNSLISDEELSINLSAEETLFARYSRAKVRQVTEVHQGYVNLNFIKGNTSQTIQLRFTGDIEEDTKLAYQKIKCAREYAQVLAEDPYLVRPQNYGSSTSESVHGELSNEEMMNAVADVASNVDLAGILTSGFVVRASMNSKGQKHWFKTQSFHLDYSLYNTRQKAVKSLYAGTHFHFEELLKNMQDSKTKLQLLDREVEKMPRGEYRIYLSPSAVSELMGTLSWGGVSMSAHKRGQGSLKDLWEGKRKLSPLFSLTEDFSINMSARFNDQGEVAPDSLPLIQNGEFKNFLTSTRTSNEFKIPTNFASDWESMRSPKISNGTILEEDILKNIGNGLYISDLHYLNWSDRETARITGMTRYACFKVVNGELVSPIEDLRFDESYYHIFGEGLLGLTNHTHLIPNTGSYFEREIGGMEVPGIVVDQFKFTL
jgi:predicted Zn-dependent protease